MARRRTHPPLQVLLNTRRVGTLRKDPDGAIAFAYHEDWLNTQGAVPVSLSLPLRETPWQGAAVSAVFENLLPDSPDLIRRVAERVGAEGVDAFSMLAAVGQDCVGALRFLPGDAPPPEAGGIEGDPVSDAEIERILNGLAQAPLGIRRDDPFRISVAGAQEKTALLREGDAWLRPRGATPTTHILKTQIGRLPGGIDLTNSVENEFYGLALTGAFGLAVTAAAMRTFGETRALVIERFDRRRRPDGSLLRLPQEDLCQALSIPPTRKYEQDGGPGIAAILDFLQRSDTPHEDQDRFVKAQIVFWLMGATDGHAKNFSLFLGPGGTFRMTPLYDVLTAEPAFAAGEIDRTQFTLAMAIGTRRRYRINDIFGRHFVQTGVAAGLGRARIIALLEEIADTAAAAVDRVEGALPDDFPAALHETVKAAVLRRAARITALDAA